MYGIVNKALKAMILSEHGEALWQRVITAAGIDSPVFIGSESYPDQWTYQLVAVTCEILNKPATEVLESFGFFWATHTAVEEYPELMATGGGSLEAFLRNLPNFHTQIVLMLPKLEPPDFRCEEVGPDRLHMHYHSKREGLAPFALGILRGLVTVFKTAAEVNQVAFKGHDAEHDIFEIRFLAVRS
jgi:hypothetical protein